jgi:N-acetylglutamate synthase-like GNAT family acetyltransferase
MNKTPEAFHIESFHPKYDQQAIQLWRKSLLSMISRFNFIFSFKKTILIQILPILSIFFGYYRLFIVLELLHFVIIFIAIKLSKSKFQNYVDTQKDMISAETICKTYLEKERNHFWIATKDEQIHGCVAVSEKSKFVAEINRMAVGEKTRGQGIASKLLKNLEDFCKQKGYTSICLSTAEIQYEAIELYKKFGFKQTGIENFYIFSLIEFEKKI